MYGYVGLVGLCIARLCMVMYGHVGLCMAM